MQQIDSKVRELKRDFTNLLYQRRPDLSQQEIDSVFKRFENFEVNKALKDLQQKHESV